MDKSNVFQNLTESKVIELFNNFVADGMSENDAFTEVYAIDCNMDNED